MMCLISMHVARGEDGECTSRGLYEGEFFPGIGKIKYEGPESTNALSFRYYNAEEVIMGKPMKEWWAASDNFSPPSKPALCAPNLGTQLVCSHVLQSILAAILTRSHPPDMLCAINRLRFSAAFWHTMRGDGSDPFGSGTKVISLSMHCAT